tara:strand:- start:393 stop:707 length:315 start_codon:yes stop_codon:yes gene_type:complete
MEDQKRKNYLSYFKLGVVDAVVNNKADNSYMKSSAYYKKGFEFGLTMNQGESTIDKIKVWLQGELSEVTNNPLYEDDDSRESALLEGRYECAEGLQTMIKQWEK